MVSTLLAARYDVGQIQQFRTDVSTTHALDGLNDAANFHDQTIAELNTLKQLVLKRESDGHELQTDVRQLHRVGISGVMTGLRDNAQLLGASSFEVATGAAQLEHDLTLFAGKGLLDA